MAIRVRQQKTVLRFVGVACVVVMLLFSGCSKRVQTDTTGEEGPSPIVTVHEFPDVPIPKELDLNAKESFIYMTPEYATGNLVYNGNVDYDSLLNFFEETLPNNGWILQASLKYTRTLLFYQKGSRICLVTMDATPLNIRVEIWVAPIEKPSEELILEPVMEPVPEPTMP